MVQKNRELPIIFIAIALMSAIILSACASQANSQSLDDAETTTPEIVITPGESDTEPAEDAVWFVTPEEARDIVIASLLQRFPLEAPDAWTIEDQTPENMVGYSTYMYTSGSWVAIVSAPVVAPENLIYSVEIDHVTSGLRWQGEVAATGEIREIFFAEPIQ